MSEIINLSRLIHTPAFNTDASNINASRLPPQSLYAEQSLLGSLMIDGTTWRSVADQVSTQDFYSKENRLIFQVIAYLAEDNRPFDIVTIGDQLERRGEIEAIGGVDYLLTIGQETPTAANVLAYAKIVRDTAILRRMISIGTGVVNSAYKPEGRTVAELLDEAERKVFEIADHVSHNVGGFQPIKGLLSKALDRIDVLFERDNPITGLATGFTDLDLLTTGLQPADLIVVAGRPSMGKTAFAMGVAAHVAIKERKPVAIFSLEMPGDALVTRLLSTVGRIDQRHVRTGKLESEEWSRLSFAVSQLTDISLFIDDTPALSPTELRAKSRRLKHEHGELALIVIDYLQLMQSPSDSENRTTEISAISRALKSLAKELNVPVIALSQLNRGLEQRTNKRPIMSDLRESGAIEQDADLILFIYRDEVYHEESPDKGIAEIIIGKQRNGPIGTVRLTFLGQYTKFENYTEATYSDDGH